MTPSSRRTSLARKRWQERRVQWVAALSLLDSPLRRPAPVVEGDDGPIGPGQGGHWLDGSMVNAGASYYPRGASVEESPTPECRGEPQHVATASELQ